MDVMTPRQRYKAMVHNRGRTRPELAFASGIWRLGLRYLTSDGFKARYRYKLPGQPDLVFPKKRVAIFIDGCFWHGCSQCKGIPTKSGDFWRRKIEGNIKRDKEVTAKLQGQGWMVLRVPEHEIRSKGALNQTTRAIAESLAQYN